MSWTLAASGTKTPTVGGALFQVTANGSWISGAVSITVSTATNTNLMFPGQSIYDLTAGVGAVGTLSSLTGVTLTITAALHASSSSSDSLAFYNSACTISIASPAVITLPNTLAVGDQVTFSVISGSLPTGISLGTVYYVIAAGLSSSQFEISATPGGAAINTTGTSTGIQTCSINHVLATDTTNATYQFEIDMSAMANGDLLQVLVASIPLSGGVQTIMWEGFFQNAQIAPLKVTPFIASDQSVQVMINQLLGTARAFPWKLLRQ